ncbi:hypothetical protein KGQ19_01980 [Catenulispora sp. NL8]|uniref:Uncharacterized protein n=1 Tax=Catenulispora pinistramenti TaxID=2705254 RepID=A0ABS5KJJ3_9ACTN|nr:DUF5994 family protein [Catenulispora pinistramenti]MBS2545629.1 hypothetical protein [Catenulispora pinistramenti]
MTDSFFPVRPLPGPGPRPFATDCLPRLVLEPAMTGTGLFDGAWWPRSSDIAAELPDLITALGAHLGRIRRVALDTGFWDSVPRSIIVNGDLVRIGWPAASAGTISLSVGILDHRLLLVVPPETARSTAAAAMAGAATTGNHTPAAELLSWDGNGSFGC